MGHITIADLQMEGWTAFVLNISWTVTIHSSSLAAAAVIWSPVRALLEVLLVSPAGHLVHGKVTWNRAPVGIPVGVSSCVAQLTADYISMATGPDIITDRSKVAVGVDCIDNCRTPQTIQQILHEAPHEDCSLLLSLSDLLLLSLWCLRWHWGHLSGKLGQPEQQIVLMVGVGSAPKRRFFRTRS